MGKARVLTRSRRSPALQEAGVRRIGLGVTPNRRGRPDSGTVGEVTCGGGFVSVGEVARMGLRRFRHPPAAAGGTDSIGLL